jgi:hypothetical protein
MNRAALIENSSCQCWPNFESSGEAALYDDGEMNPLFETGSRHCAYNETRECFLGLQIMIADIEAAQFELRLANLSLKSGEGLWLRPFRGIHPNSGGPVDLVYLDEKHRVIEAVESFPTCQANATSARAASVLVLPVHSIFWTQTQPDDQLMLCGAEEMQSSLRQLTGAKGPAGTPPREKSPRRDLPRAVENENCHNATCGTELADQRLSQPALNRARRLHAWFQRWWSTDPRRSPRELAPGMAADTWNDAAQKVRDISSTGLYLVTESRSYPGSVVLMNLQRSGCGDLAGGCAIPVHSLVIRSGADGVGLQFVLEEGSTKASGPGVAEVVNGKQLEQFLRSLRKDKR